MSGFNTTKYFGTPPSEQFWTENRYNYVASAGQTIFPASYTVGFVDVYKNGLHLDPTTAFTAVNGSNVVLTSGATAGDSVVIVAKPLVRTVDTYTQSQVNAIAQSFYGVATGTANAITVSTNPSFSSFIDGMEIRFRASASNTVNNPTLSFNGLAAKTIVRDNGAALAVTDWSAADELTVRYVASLDKFVLMTNKFQALKANNGYQRLPSGVILQWGYVAAAASTGAVTFPLAFPNNPVSLVINSTGNNNTTAVSVNPFTYTPTQFSYTKSTGAASDFNWIAIGY